MANIYDIALTLTPKLGASGVAHLLERFSSAENIYSATLDELIHFGELNPRVAKSIIAQEGMIAARLEMEFCTKNNITPIASTDSEYPEMLREANDFPHILYVKGDTSILNNRAISIVGTRKMTPYGQRACDTLIKEIAECVPDAVIVSGLAFGIDSAAHRSAIQHNIPTIAVLPCPLSTITPAQHTQLAREIVEKGGALVTELHSQIEHKGRFYISRNRIIAGYSGATIIVESPECGGAMYTAKSAYGYDRIVGAVPGRVTDFMSTGCNKLISSRVAIPILSGADIIRELMWDTEEGVKAQSSASQLRFTADEEKILRCFCNDEPIYIDRLSVLSGLSIGELSAQMMSLELIEAVRLLPGGKYERLIPLNMIQQ